MAFVAQAFLFNADAEGVSSYYGGDFEPPFLRALSAVDPGGITRSTVLLGDVIVSSLCERVIAVSGKPRESSHTVGHDMDLYRTIIWDLADGFVTMELSFEGTPETTFAGADQFVPHGERRVPYGELDDLKPPLPKPPHFSARGQISADRYHGKRRYTVHDRVLLALSRLWPQSGEPVAFSFDALRLAKADVLEAELPEAKFVRYLLNPDHADGRGKAKFFSDELGIVADDWRYLAAQLYGVLKKADLAKLKVKAWEDGYGASFNCVMPVLGLNGRVAMIETNWILRPGLLPQLSTALPAGRDDNAKVDCDQITIVPSTLTGDPKWEAVYAAAHGAGSLAAEKCVPTPMKVVGYDVIMEGACGYAHIRIPDARKGFARWAVRSGRGSNHYRSGAEIYASVDSQSFDRAVAYAEAFAAVLHLNGIECSVQSRLD